jgi:hypothetical protein
VDVRGAAAVPARVDGGEAQCQISTLALVTGAQLAPALTTAMASASGVPWRSSRTSLLTGRSIDGNGPAVSLGVTTQAADAVPGAVVIVVAVVDAGVGLVGEPLLQAIMAAPAAPITPSASRRLTVLVRLACIVSSRSFLQP